MFYLLPKQSSIGAFCAPQSQPAPGLLKFPDEYLTEFFKPGKQAAGFVTIEHDGKTVTSCVWNENAYLAYLATLPEPSLAEVQDQRIAEVQDQRIAESKTALSEYLESHPLTWTDGKQYSVTAEKQNLLTGNLSAYSIAVQLGVTPNPLTWNTTGSECTEWTFADLGTLALAIQAYVKPFVSYQQSKELEIKACTTVEDVEAVVIDYDSVTA